tara:strand:- start:8775 stop:9377 length:603 start_codon:yes stop_codon:yes gene_type:complete
MIKISQGAEASIYREEDIIVKHRTIKSYRNKDIDNKLRKHRTRREAKVLKKLETLGFPAPKIIKDIDEISMKIEMEHINGEKLRDFLHKNHKELSNEIGKKIAILHNNDIIHGDLTTSNMIVDEEIYLIDFGLSFFSTKPEDKAVDLHLLKRALESKHHMIFEECFNEIIKAYKEHYLDHEKVLNRLEQVEKRGRNKHKG